MNITNQQNQENPRKIIDGVIRNDENNILVIDKIKPDGRKLTILPGGKLENGETKYDCLIREIKEEIGLTISHENIGEFIGETTQESPSSKINSTVELYQINTKVNIEDIVLEEQLDNARFLSESDILKIETVTTLTKNSILQLLNIRNINILVNGAKYQIGISHDRKNYIYLFNNELYIFPIEKLKFKNNSTNKETDSNVCFIEEFEFVYGEGKDKNSAFSDFLAKFISYLIKNKMTGEKFINKLVI